MIIMRRKVIANGVTMTNTNNIIMTNSSEFKFMDDVFPKKHKQTRGFSLLKKGSKNLRGGCFQLYDIFQNSRSIEHLWVAGAGM